MANKDQMLESLSKGAVSVGMSEWENQFVVSLKGFTSDLSSKQLNKLTDLYIKHIPPGQRV